MAVPSRPAHRAGAAGRRGADLVDRPAGQDRRAGAARKRVVARRAHRRDRADRGAARAVAPLAHAQGQPAPDRGPDARAGRAAEPARSARQRRTESAEHALHRSGRHPQADAPARRRQEAGLARLAVALRRQLSLRPALVRLHRRAGLGQDHGAGQLGPVVSAGRQVRPRRDPRRRRHAQLRLVVHRRGGADRHRRPLHHAGQPRGGRQGRVGRLPGPAEESRGRAGRSTACSSP